LPRTGARIESPIRIKADEITGMRFVIIFVTAIATLFASSALTAEVDTSAWICEFCPFESGHRADYELGASYVSEDSAYIGDASGYAEEGAYLNVDGQGSYYDDSYQMQWTVEDLGLDSRSAEISGGRQGTYDYHLSYRQLPRHVYDTTATIFEQVSADTLDLPSGWVTAPLTSGFTELNSSLVSRNIESERKSVALGGRYKPSDRFRISADFRRQKRDGTDVFAGSYFSQSSLLPRPFDYETNEIDLDVRYVGDRGFLTLAYYASLFDNSNAELRWENPFTSSPGAEQGALAQPPDNTFQQVSLSGSYRFAPYRIVLSFSGALGSIEQDETFLPYTINPNLSTSPLPQAQLDGSVDTTNLAFTLTSKPHRRARVVLAYRYDERDNKTTQMLWNRVVTDTFNSADVETNVPYSYERSKLNLSGHFALTETVRISGGYDRTTVDRNFQEVAEQTEDSGWGQVRWRPNAHIEISGRAGTSERDFDRYDETIAAGLGQNPIMRKYNLAYRYRQFGDLTLSASLPEKPVSLTLTALFANDDYMRSQLGLIEGDDLRLAADLSWSLSDTASMYLNAGFESIESQQAGSEQFSTPDWQAVSSDDFYTVGVGFRVNQVADKFDLQFDYLRSQGSSEIDVDSASGGLSRFPDLESTLDSLRIRLTYRKSERLELALRLRYESFEAEDWSLEGVGPDTIPVVLTLGAEPYDSDVFIVGLAFRYLTDFE
jgi:MtrB/PioB family decaheme-associated outer membrane protein